MKSPRSQYDAGDFSFGYLFGFQPVWRSAYAELAHEVLHVIVHCKAHNLAIIVEFLFYLVLYIHGIAIPPGHCLAD